MRARWAVSLLLLGLLATLGVIGANRLLRAADAVEPFALVEVRRATLRDTMLTRGSVEREALGTLVFDAPGRVTEVAVSPGDVAAAGRLLFRINGRPVVAAEGDFPFWRPLAEGDRGPDVLQLEQMLERTGLSPGEVDGVFDQRTGDAVEAWYGGLSDGFITDRSFRASDTLVTHWPARIATVGVRVGDFVNRGTSALELTGQELEIVAELTPTQRLQVQVGQRCTVEVTATRQSASAVIREIREARSTGDPRQLAGALASSAGFEAVIELDEPLEIVEGVSLQVSFVLAEVTDAIVVPLAAVMLDGLGRTIVKVYDPDGAPEQVLIETGLSEGSFIEVRSGLAGSETVVIEAR